MTAAMDVAALHDLVRAEVQQRPTQDQSALRRLSPSQRQAFRALQRRMRRERPLGRPLAAPEGAIASAPITSEIQDVLRLLLGRSGFALAPEGRDRWAPYVFDTARA